MPIHLLITMFPSPAKNYELESELALKATFLQLKSIIYRYENQWCKNID